MKLEIDKSLLETFGQTMIQDEEGHMVRFPGYDEDEEMVKAEKLVAIVNAHDDLVTTLRRVHGMVGQYYSAPETRQKIMDLIWEILDKYGVGS